MAFENRTYVGLPSLPSSGPKKTRFPDVRFRATVYKHPPKPGSRSPTIQLTTPSDRSVTGRASSDLIVASTTKSLGQPMGAYNLTLVPRQDYIKLISPGDWCEVESTNGNGSGFLPLMYGPISSVRRTRNVNDRGAHSTLIRISGNDFGKPIANTTALYDPKLANDPAFSNLGLAQVVQEIQGVSGPPDAIIKGLIKRYLSTGIQQWFDPKTNKPFGAGVLLGSDSVGYISDQLIGNAVVLPFTLSASLWQVLQQWANLSVNEMFLDYRPPLTDPNNIVDLVPALILRQYPFYGSSWDNLAAILVNRSECISEDLGKDDGDVRNWIRALDEPTITGFPNGMQVYQDNAGVVNPTSIKKFGFRRFEMPTQYIFDWRAPTEQRKPIQDIVAAHSGLQAQWHHSNEELLSGNLELYHRPDIRVGYRLDYSDNETGELFQFYVESVQHSLAYPGRSSTVLTVTRGRDVNDPDTSKRFAYDIGQLQTQGVLEQLGNTIDRSLTALSNTSELRGPAKSELPASISTGTAIV